jgi:hypothetical protein
MGDYAPAGAGGSVDGTEGSHEEQLGGIDPPGEESRYVCNTFSKLYYSVPCQELYIFRLQNASMALVNKL